MGREAVAQKLIALRNGKPRIAVAKDLNISRSALMMYENGKRTPKDEIKAKIAKYYGVSIESIFFSDL